MSAPALAAAESQSATGFYGKLPDRGDFVQRRLPNAMITPWDAWLREGMATSQVQLGDAWAKLYMTFPIWRFALSPGLCGPDGIVGVLMPSVDAVARNFPLTIAASTGAMPAAIAAESGRPWFAAAEPLALAALDEPFDFEAWDARLAALPAPSPCEEDLSPAMPVRLPLRLPIAPRTAMRGVCSGLADALLRWAAPSYSLWWTDGSVAVASTVLVMPGLPDPTEFAILLSNDPRCAAASDRCATSEP